MANLRPSLFEDGAKELYQIIASMHDKFSRDISTNEMFAYWRSQNPSSTGAWTDEIETLVNNISEAPDLNSEVASDVIENLWRQSIGLDIANLGIKMSEGDATAMDNLNVLLSKVSAGFVQDNFDDYIVTADVHEMLATVSNDNRFRFNIPTLARHVYGLARGEFGVIAAYSNVGKTALAVSLCVSPDGFCHQGAKVAYIANEEFGKRTKFRALMAYNNLSREEVEFNPDEAEAKFNSISGNLLFMESHGWELSKLDAFLAEKAPDICIVDMADKVALTQQFNSGHERLRDLYYRLRELAKKHNCAVIGVSQCSSDAEGKTILTMSMLEGSKVGKQSECDLLIGVGAAIDKNNLNDTTRYINVMKNKISGWHGVVICNLNGKTSRYGV